MFTALVICNTLILLSGILFIIWKKIDFLSPICLYFLGFFGAFTISSFMLSDLQDRYSLSFILLIYASLLFFCAGAAFAWAHVQHRKTKVRVMTINPTRLSLIIKVLTWICLLAALITFMYLGPPPLLGGVDRVGYYLPIIERFFSLIYFVIFLLIYDRFTVRSISTKQFFLYSMMLLVVVLTRMNKMQLIFISFEYIALYGLLANRLSLKKITLWITGVLVVFISMYLLFYGNFYNMPPETRVDVNQYESRFAPELLVDPYMYIAYNFENLRNHTFEESDKPYTYGYNLIKPFLALIGLDNFIGLDEKMNESWKNNLSAPWLTTGTIYKDAVSDFSYFGYVIYPIIFGFLTTLIYLYARRYKDIFYSFLYVIFSYAILLSFFSNILGDAVWLLNIIICAIVTRFIYTSPSKTIF